MRTLRAILAMWLTVSAALAGSLEEVAAKLAARSRTAYKSIHDYNTADNATALRLFATTC